MKQLFDELSFKISRETTRKYSTSFSLGVLALSADIRPAIYSIYGFVRLADEIVDSFHDYDRSALIGRLRNDTVTAIQEKIAINPILHAFQHTVNNYGIDWQWIDTFLQSMEMDLTTAEHSRSSYEKYILGSAEVVGLMCLHVFVNGDTTQFERLKSYAMTLGSAFQKVNFLRDLRDDYRVLGRSYFPSVDMCRFDLQTKALIEQEINKEFEVALEGIRMLPASSRLGVHLAYTYYRCLFNKIKRTTPQDILNKRVRINNGKKLSLMMSSYVQVKMTWL